MLFGSENASHGETHFAALWVRPSPAAVMTAALAENAPVSHNRQKTAQAVFCGMLPLDYKNADGLCLSRPALPVPRKGGAARLGLDGQRLTVYDPATGEHTAL